MMSNMMSFFLRDKLIEHDMVTNPNLELSILYSSVYLTSYSDSRSFLDRERERGEN